MGNSCKTPSVRVWKCFSEEKDELSEGKMRYWSADTRTREGRPGKKVIRNINLLIFYT